MTTRERRPDRAQSAGGAVQKQQPTAGGGSVWNLSSPSRPAPLSSADIEAGLRLMADMVDPDLAARKVVRDFDLSRPHRKD